MKYLLQWILLIGLLCPASHHGQTTAIPDPVFEQFLIDQGWDTGTPDGAVSTANIQNISILNMNGLDVSNMTGVEAFANLRVLLLGNNPQLTSLDVSNNTALTDLSIHSTGIAQIDIRNNGNLEKFFAYNTPLTTIDFSGNLLLTDIYISDTQISSLNVQVNSDLKEVRAQNMPLSSISFGANTQVEVLFIDGTQIKQLDAGMHPKLKNLHIYNSEIEEIFVDFCPLLEELRVNDSPIEYLRLQDNPNLTLLRAHNTPNLVCISVADVNAAANGTGIYNNWLVDSNAFYDNTCTVSYEEIRQKEKNCIVPNPVGDQFRIDLRYSTFRKAVIYDLMGRQVLETSVTEIETTALNRGTYLIHIDTDAGRIVKKITK